jgi:hypothetical protein
VFENLFSASGGKVYIRLFDSDWEELDLLTLEAAQWSIRPQVVGVDATTILHTGTRGGTKGYTLDWSVSLPADQDNLPENEGIVVGEACEVWFKVGELSLWHHITHSQIAAVNPMNDSTGDLFRIVIQGVHGELTPYSASDPTYSPPPPPPPPPPP